MGWSIETIRAELDAVFGRAGIKYDVLHTTDVYPRVTITYDGDLPLLVLNYIVKLFPDNVYVDIKRITFSVESKKEE